MVAHDVLVSTAKILRSTDQDFVARLLEDLKANPGRVNAAAMQGAELTLHQPVHRVFHMAVIELICDRFGNPRLDPRHIDSAGIVIRRVRKDGGREGWMRVNERPAGWQRLTAGDTIDPDPAHRAPLLPCRPDYVPLAAPPAETFSPMFPVPPDVAEAAGRTVLYGVLPVGDAEVSEGGPPLRLDSNAVTARMPSLLRANTPATVPYAGVWVSRDDAAAMPDFTGQLRQIAVEMDALGDQNPELYQALNEVVLPSESDGRRLGDFLRVARGILLLGGDGAFMMPEAWPVITPEQAARIASAAYDSMQARLNSYVPGEQRFERAAARYRLRAFVRLKHDCIHPELKWSEESQPFRIAPWHEAAEGVAPVRIQLPDIKPRSFFLNPKAAAAALKPNAVFAVPDELAGFLAANEGKKGLPPDGPNKGAPPGLCFLCGFNIPIITMVAFILLNMILGLLNIVFWWLPLVKVCVPMPQPPGEES